MGNQLINPHFSQNLPKNPKLRVKELRDRYLNDIQAKLTEDGTIDPDYPGNNSLIAVFISID